MENLASGAWSAFGSAWKGSTQLVNKYVFECLECIFWIHAGLEILMDSLDHGSYFLILKWCLVYFDLHVLYVSSYQCFCSCTFFFLFMKFM